MDEFISSKSWRKKSRTDFFRILNKSLTYSAFAIIDNEVTLG